MCLRPRKIDVRITNRENLVEPPRKQIRKNVTTKRPALVELGDQLMNQSKKPKKEQVKNLNAKSQPRNEQANSTNATTVESTFKRQKELSKLSRILELMDIFRDDVDTIEYLHSVETKFPIKKGYLTNHRTTPQMRTTLINWMVNIITDFKFTLDTFYLSVSLLDRYLQRNISIGRETLQLVGVTAICLASKYNEEICKPKLSNFANVCDNPFTTTDILKIEVDMLLSHKFNLGLPIHFLRFLDSVVSVASDRHNLAEYLLGIFLLHHESHHINPSLQAAAACCLSVSILSEVSDPSEAWTLPFVFVSTYKYTDIKPVLLKLAKFLYELNTSKFPAMREKYASEIHEKVSLDPKLRGPLIRKLVYQSSLKD
ncbi:hypothetical protein RI129_011663 [Pyrocoelia pectoralis]|uniref:Uncharacterized protein n=1 Tax=Pyrocoelia pectoralis TaxID=417401 RepID=A0AAN7ZG25_9COLE